MEILKSGEKIIRIDVEDFERLEEMLAELPEDVQKKERERLSMKYCDIKFDDPDIVAAREKKLRE